MLGVQCSAQVEVDTVEMTVSGLRDTDIYHCDIEILFPPPYSRISGNVTLIHILGKASSWHACACKGLGLPFWVQLLQPLQPLQPLHPLCCVHRELGVLWAAGSHADCWLIWSEGWWRKKDSASQCSRGHTCDFDPVGPLHHRLFPGEIKTVKIIFYYH